MSINVFVLIILIYSKVRFINKQKMINISNQDESSSYLSTQSPYFIDAFFIIGFEIEPLNNDLNRYLINTSQITSQTFGMYKYSNKPTIINSI